MLPTKCVLGQLTFVLVLASGVISSASADLVGYWDFEGTASDRGTLGLHGSLVGDAHFSDSVPAMIDSRQSMRLDGEGDWVALGNPAELNFTTHNWTVAGWMNTTRTGMGDENEGTLFGNGGDWQGGVRYTIVLSEGGREGVPTLVIDDNAAAPGSRFNKEVLTARTAVNDGQWHHVAGVREDGELRLYVDGEMEGRLRFHPAYDLTGIDQHPAYIGAITDNRDGEVFKNFDGWLDDVAIWSNALTDSQISALASGNASPLTVPEPCSGLLWMTLLMLPLRHRLT